MATSTPSETLTYEHVHEEILLAQRANPDTANAQGYSPIEVAKRRNYSSLASLMEAHIDKKLSLSAVQNGVEPLYTVQKVADILSVDETFVLELIKARKSTAVHLDEMADQDSSRAPGPRRCQTFNQIHLGTGAIPVYFTRSCVRRHRGCDQESQHPLVVARARGLMAEYKGDAFRVGQHKPIGA